LPKRIAASEAAKKRNTNFPIRFHRGGIAISQPYATLIVCRPGINPGLQRQIGLKNLEISTKEEIMAVKVLIRRTFTHATTKDISAMLIQARSNAMKQEGYITSETLTSAKDPNTIMVIAMWRSIADWHNYRDSAARQENERKYSEIIQGETQYEEFQMGLTQ
jgi:heme-degrading monooxygenase HmoA